MEYGALYFYTSIIYQWKPLIHQYNFYETITRSLPFLHKRGVIKVYGFVIMPDHIHLIRQLLKSNGKESPTASLMKFTAHSFEHQITQTNPSDLNNYRVDSRSRKYNFWQPEPDGFLLFKEKTTMQKLNYLHHNPLQEKWKLADNPADYKYSSAKLYETGVNAFDFLCPYLDFDNRTSKPSLVAVL